MPGSPIVGVPDTHPTNGAPCQSFDVPGSVPNKNGATLTIEKSGFIPIVLHGILDTVTPGGGGFECDVFRLQGRCNFEVTTPQPITFGRTGGNGTFEVKAKAGCKWWADRDQQAEDFVHVDSHVVDGTGTKTFSVDSDAVQPPLPRSGSILILAEDGAVLTKVLIQQHT
jgi:hypothetical protein